jgi:hypothetical protein
MRQLFTYFRFVTAPYFEYLDVKSSAFGYEKSEDVMCSPLSIWKVLPIELGSWDELCYLNACNFIWRTEVEAVEYEVPRKRCRASNGSKMTKLLTTETVNRMKEFKYVFSCAQFSYISMLWSYCCRALESVRYWLCRLGVLSVDSDLQPALEIKLSSSEIYIPISVSPST